MSLHNFRPTERGAIHEKIKKGYRKSLRRYHPDNNTHQNDETKQKNTEKRMRISVACKVLKVVISRRV